MHPLKHLTAGAKGRKRGCDLGKDSIEYSHPSKYIAIIDSPGLMRGNAFPNLRNPEECSLLRLIAIDIAEVWEATGPEGLHAGTAFGAA